jgi:DNA end-binding protein Ku
LEIARRLVGSLTGDFDPGRQRDEYRERVLELIERKAAGQPVEPPEEEPPAEAADLMAALEASLAAGR